MKNEKYMKIFEANEKFKSKTSHTIKKKSLTYI